MREQILNAAVELLRLEGPRGLSMRAVSAHGSVSLGAIQFHFRNQRAFANDVLRWWGAQISRALSESSRGTLGVARTWSLCQSWVAIPDAELIALLAVTPRSRSGASEVASATLFELMDEWIGETRRSLHQAQIRGELKSEVDPRAAALDLHRLLWSHSWGRFLLGQDASARAILVGAWQRLSAVAAEETHLPPRPAPTLPPPLQVQAPDPDSADMPTWTYLLERSDPLFHAFLRHEIMDDPRTFFRPPKVLPEDEREAEKYRAQHTGDGSPCFTPDEGAPIDQFTAGS